MADISAMGDLVLTVGGDLSPLEATLQQVPAAAQTAGAAINSALGSSLDSATASLGNLQTAIESINSQSASGLSTLTAQMDLFAASTQNASTQLELFTQGTLEDAKSGFSGIEQNATAATPALNELAGAESNAGDGAGYFASGLIRIGERIVEAMALYELVSLFKDLAAGSLEAYANLQSVSVSLEHFTGSAEAASSEIAQLEEMASNEALSLPELEKADVNMKALGLSSSQTTQLLQMVADASATMGISFESAATRIEAMVTSGTVMTRSLASMGVSADALAQAMNTSTSDIAKSFKALDQSERIEVLKKAMQDLAGMAVAQADTIGGAWRKLKAETEVNMEQIGSAIVTVGAVIHVWAASMGFDVTSSLALLQKAAHGATQAVTEVNAAIPQGQGEIAKWIVAQNNLNDSLTKAKQHLADVSAQLKSGMPVQAEYAAAVDAVTTAQQAADPIGFAAHQQAVAEATRAAEEAAKSYQQQLDQSAKAAQSFVQWLDKMPQSAAAFNVEMSKSKDWLDKSDQLFADIQKKLNPLIADWAEFSASGTKAGEAMAASLLKVILQGETLRNNIKNWQADFGNFEKEFETLPVIAALTTSEFKAITAASKEARDPIQTILDQLPKAQDVLGRLAVNTKAWDDALKQLGLEGKRSLDQVNADLVVFVAALKSGQYNTDQLSSAFDTLEGKVKKAGGDLRELLPILAQMNASTDQELKLWNDILEQDLKHDAALKTIAEDLAHISSIQFKNFLDQSSILIDTWKGIETAFTNAFHSLSQGVAQAIVEGKSFSDVWHNIVKQLAEEILTQIVEGAFREMLGGIAKLSGGLLSLGGSMTQVTSDMTNVSKAAGDMATSVSSASTSAMSNIQSVGSGALSIINTISGIVSAIGSMMSAVELKHTNTLLSRIEESTRYAKRYLGEMGDGIYETMHDVKDILTQIEKDLQDINGSVKNIKSAGGGGPTGPAPIGVDANGNPIPAGQEGSAAAIIDAQQAALDPWRQAMDAIVAAMEPIKDSLGHVISGVENDTVRWGLATAALQDAVSGDMAGALQALQSAGLNMAQATDVLARAGFSYLATADRATTSIDTSLANIATGAGVMAQAATVTAAATMQVAASMGIAPLLPTVTSQTVPNIPVTNFAAPGATPFAPTFGAGTPTGLASQYNSAPSITVTVQAGVVAGQGGMQQLAQMVGDKIIDGFRRAGMRF